MSSVRAKLPTADPATVGALLAAHGDAGWLAVTQRYGRVFRYQRGVVTCEPDELQALLSTREHTRRRPATHRFADRFVPGAAGILFKEGDAWKQRLRPLMMGFQPQAVEVQEARLRDLVERYVGQWPAMHTGPDLFAEVTALGLRIALVHGYNLDPSDPVVQDFGALLVSYKRATMDPNPRRRLDEFGLLWRKAFDLPWVASAFYNFRRYVRRLDGLVAEILRRGPWADPVRQGWIQTLAAAGVRGRALTSELNHLYGAFTAADYTATCALAELAHAPKWVARLRRADASQSGIDAVEAVLRETSRRYPVAMVIYRELGKTMTLGGESFPAGTLVMALPYALHHDPAWWDQPAVYDPGRWQGELPPRALAAYEPFLKGPRRCIGQDFARQQLRVVLEAILRRYDPHLLARPRVNTFIVPRLAEPLAFRFDPAEASNPS